MVIKKGEIKHLEYKYGVCWEIFSDFGSFLFIDFVNPGVIQGLVILFRFVVFGVHSLHVLSTAE